MSLYFCVYACPYEEYSWGRVSHTFHKPAVCMTLHEGKVNCRFEKKGYFANSPRTCSKFSRQRFNRVLSLRSFIPCLCLITESRAAKIGRNCDNLTCQMAPRLQNLCSRRISLSFLSALIQSASSLKLWEARSDKHSFIKTCIQK